MSRSQKLIVVALGLACVCLLVCMGVLLIGALAQRRTATISENQAQQSAATVVAPQTAAPAPTEAPPPTSAPSPTTAPTAVPTVALNPVVGNVGQKIESGGVALTVVKVSRVKQIGDFLTPKAGNTFVVLDVIVENVSRDDEAPYNELYFKLNDDQGFTYASTLLAPDPSFQSGSLAKGTKARGNVAFEVPTNAKGLVVTYEPLVLLGGYAPIRVALGQ